jgi:cobalt/nickel transport system permease protein
MQTSWHNILGSGHGPVCRLAPQTRIMAGVVLFTACIVAPATTAPGILVIVASTVCWIITCGPPWRAVMSFSMFGLAVFLPYFLLVPLILVRGSGQGEEWTDALAVPWGVFLHGMTGILVSTSTAMTLSPSDLRIGALRLPVPGMVSAILLQIVHQTSELAYETRRVAAAFAIRGASTRWRTSMRLLSSIPKVWLPRVLIRADRVAAAMEVRGFCEADPQVFGRLSMKRADVATLSIAIGVLVLATALRLGVFG